MGLAAVALARTAQADNTESFFYSDDAAMTAGTVSATTRDAGAVWYNPAGLGGIKRGQIDLSGSAFGIRIRNVAGAIGTTFPNGKQLADIKSGDIYSAPQAISLVRRINEKISIGGGLFVTTRDVRTGENDVELKAPAIGDPNTVGTYRQRLDVNIEQTRYHFGPAIGIEVAEGFRVGASLFGTYAKQNGFLQFLIGQQATLATGQSTLLAIGQSRVANSYFGLQPQVGLQWDPSPTLTLSLVVRSPEVLIATSVDSADFQQTGLVVPGRDPILNWSLLKNQNAMSAGSIVAPLRVIAGIGKQIADRSWISAEVDFHAPFANDFTEQHVVVNGRAGGRFRVSNTLSVGVGLYTDLTGLELGDEFGDEKVNELGGTFGFELRTPLSLSENPAPDALVLSTTLALKYGIGIGQFRAQDLDLTSGDDPPARKVDVTYHTILPYIGSSILF